MQITTQTNSTVNANSSAVVSNDTYAKLAVGQNVNVIVDANEQTATTPIAAPSLASRIERLVSDRVQWEQGVLRTSNEQLYALLAKCYAMYFEFCGKTAGAKALRAELEKFISQKGYRFNESSHTITKIVKCVFGAVDRRRISTYSLVLRVALAKKLTTDGVAAFIAENGGVEEIRRSKSPTAKTPKVKAELGAQAVSGNELAVVRSDKISQSLNVENVGCDLVAIVTQQADGSLIVRQLIKSQSALNAALASVYSTAQADAKATQAAADKAIADAKRKAREDSAEAKAFMNANKVPKKTLTKEEREALALKLKSDIAERQATIDRLFEFE